MAKSAHTGRRYAAACMMAAAAGILGLIDPVLTSLLVSRVMKGQDFSRVSIVLVSLLAVKGTRIYARITMSKMLGNNQRAPLIWLRRRIGGLFWWLEPLLHNWGTVGLVVDKVFGSTGAAAQIASFISYALTDLIDSFVAGFIYYLTENYVLSFASAMILPTLFVLPWYQEKTRRLYKKEERRALKGGGRHSR